MTLEFDAAGDEVRALLGVIGELSGKTVLEIGSGNGRLTWRYAEQAGRVHGIDPKPGMESAALAARPVHLAEKVTFGAENLEAFTEQTKERFDLALLSWSL